MALTINVELRITNGGIFREYRDTLLAFTGIIIALLSLWFTWSQRQEQIKHNHISVEPRMNAYFSNDGRVNKSGIYIINNGMGTAFVSAISVTVNGKKLNLLPGIFLSEQCRR